ncbi:MAG: GNAT family N-acetyltransferase [Caldilineae bacterium]|nr:MAG: GNAT family N-acetyltransferase [Caldilineae bacterium]
MHVAHERRFHQTGQGPARATSGRGTGRRMMSDIVVRPARPEDTERVLAYLDEILREPHSNLLSDPEEFARRFPPDRERAFIEQVAASDTSLFLIAEEGDEIVGQLTLLGSERKALRHTATLGISVRRDRRNRGIGRRLMTEAIAWARDRSTLRRIELNVFVRNEPAVHLYRSLGFEIEGRRRRSIYKDGEYIDDFIMALLL